MMIRRWTLAALCANAVFLAAATTAHARVTAFEIVQEPVDAYEARSFGSAGSYQEVRAIARFAVRPDDAANAGIVDIDKAPRNAAGEVEFSSEVTILQPADPARGNGVIFYEVPNRGRNLSIALLNDGPVNPDASKAANAGNGYLFNTGYTVVLSGWQFDAPEKLLGLTVPVAEGTTGLSREEFVFDNDEPTVTRALSYPAESTDLSRASLTVRVHERDERRQVAGLGFRYVDDTHVEITRPVDMPAGAIYEFIYPARDSKVAGLGFAATRDLLSFLRGSDGHDVASPLAGIRKVIGLGISQSGRFARDFVYQGFNSDEQGARVFDGVVAHIAGSRKTFTNYRFAQPGRYSRQHEDHAYPGDQFPFTYATTTNPITGKSDGIFKRCTESGTCPKLMHTDTDTEFWQARSSLVSTQVDGKPAPVPSNVRLYYLTGMQHFTVEGAPIKAGKACVFDGNAFHAGAAMRGIVTGLRDWVVFGALPPASRFPDRVGTTLVAPEELAPVEIPGRMYQANVNRLAVMDHEQMPPVAGDAYPVYVPATNRVGNAIAGVRLPRIDVPLGTHTGWNLRKKGFGEGDLCSLSGSYVPLARTADTRADGDGRPAIDQLYKSRADYLAQVKASIADLRSQRLVLDGDLPMLRERAAAYWDGMAQ